MSSRVVLTIGVRRTKGLVPLPGAIRGAMEFDAWGKRYGYTTYLCTDDQPDFGIASLRALVSRIVEACPERLIIYFAGHGCEPTTGLALWLLPGWEEDSHEAIELNLSTHNALRSAIPQVAIFADTCRTQLPGTTSVKGSSLFPRQRRSTTITQIDRFLATGPECTAQEIVGGKDSYGIFFRMPL